MDQVRAIDGTHDWVFGSGTSSYVYNNNAVAQNINTRLNSFLGNCFFDLGSGIDWINLLGGKNQNALNLAITGIILNTQNVTGLLQFFSSLSAQRVFTVQYQVQTVYSKVQSTFIFDNSTGGG